MQIQTEYGNALVLLDCPTIESTERLEFLTEIHLAFDGSEHREVLREQPRITLEYKYKGDVKLFNDFYANLRGLFAVPQSYLKQKITVDNSNIIELDYIDEFNNYVLIGSEVYRVIEQTAIGIIIDSIITVSDVYIAPLRLCIIDEDVDISTLGFYAEQEMVFRVIAEDLPTIKPSGQDVVFDGYFRTAGMASMSLSQDQTIVDNDVGGFQSFTKWKHPRYSKPYLFVLNRDEFIANRRLLMHRMGRYGEFWLPLYENHLDIVDSGTDWIQVSNLVTRKHLAIKSGGLWGKYEIVSNEDGKLTLDRVITGAIEKVYYMGLYRFDNDAVTYSFLGNNIVKTTILIVELES